MLLSRLIQVYHCTFRTATLIPTFVGQDAACPSEAALLFLAKANEQPSLTCGRLCFYFLSRPVGMSVSWQSCMELQSITLGRAGPDQTALCSVFSLGTECCKLKNSVLLHYVTGNFPLLWACLCKEA